MNKEELEAFARKTAESLKSEKDLTEFRQMLTALDLLALTGLVLIASLDLSGSPDATFISPYVMVLFVVATWSLGLSPANLMGFDGSLATLDRSGANRMGCIGTAFTPLISIIGGSPLERYTHCYTSQAGNQICGGTKR